MRDILGLVFKNFFSFKFVLLVKKVTLPASLKKIGLQAFLGTHLEEVVFSAELQEIDDEAFRGVVELTSVTLSNNM